MRTSKVKLSAISYPYVNIEVQNEADAEKIGINLKKLYLYIDQHVNMGRTHKFGNALKAIRMRATRMMGRGDMRVSKREVWSLVRCGSIWRKRYIKVPYKMFFIFKAIFEIVDELKIAYPLPADLKNFVGKMRRDCFYDEQVKAYKNWYGQTENKNLRRKALLDDMDSEDSILSDLF